MRSMTAAFLAVFLAACSGGATATTDATPGTAAPTTATTTPGEASFPVTVSGTNGEVTIEERPGAIVSLSPTATEMLFEVGAGDQVVAVDEYSYFPAEAPVTDLSGFTPNIEAITEYDPDLVVISDDIEGVAASLGGLGIEVLQLSGLDVLTLDDVYAQIQVIGAATGHSQEAAEVVSQMKAGVTRAVESTPPSDTPLTYYHELDSSHFTVTSSTFIGHLYGLFGLENIADPADADGASFGYPQLSAEFILDADPDFIFLTDCCADTAQSVGERAGWDQLTAVRSGSIVVFDDDVSSRWGPRVVEFVRGIGRAIAERNPT